MNCSIITIMCCLQLNSVVSQHFRSFDWLIRIFNSIFGVKGDY
jgi:hypothetical protein